MFDVHLILRGQTEQYLRWGIHSLSRWLQTMVTPLQCVETRDLNTACCEVVQHKIKV